MDTMVTSTRQGTTAAGAGSAVTVTRPVTPTRTARFGGNGPGGKNGGGSGGDRGGGGGGQDWTPDRYRIGMWVGIGSILMLFTALTSAYIVRAGLPGSNDWQPITMPPLVWVSTALIIASSFTIVAARKALARDEMAGYERWLWVTLLLGVGFIGMQLLAWRQLVGQGVYLASNPHSSFFYVMTGLHGLHILGGVLALTFMVLRVRRQRGTLAGRGVDPKRRVATDVLGIYWHFMDGLWVYLLLLLILWR